MFKYAICFVALLVLSSSATGKPVDDRTLVGLEGVAVFFKDYPKELEDDGLTAKQIAIDIQVRLRKAGIKVLEDSEISKTPGQPILLVNISSMKNATGLYVISIRLELQQFVSLYRKPSITTLCTTWEVSNLVTVGTAKLRSVRDEINDGVDVFINDYLKMNPK